MEGGDKEKESFIPYYLRPELKTSKTPKKQSNTPQIRRRKTLNNVVLDFQKFQGNFFEGKLIESPPLVNIQ